MSYVDQLIEFGVALIGPGDAGEWNSVFSDDDYGGNALRRFAMEPALGYASALEVTCDLVVTDGLRYRLYDGPSGFQPAAYANLMRLKQSSESCSCA